nr:immunoglobulin heavy chain junction region [Macaca mulatta]MOV40227.1 immunoglobulin heavy chain junction region [Macaca mulatta]MOV42089.1 immunoglobulin heavy chain junction region [Macaca mulatta]
CAREGGIGDTAGIVPYFDYW